MSYHLNIMEKTSHKVLKSKAEKSLKKTCKRTGGCLKSPKSVSEVPGEGSGGS